MHRALFCVLISLFALTTPGRALAWVETTVKSDNITVDVARDGSAVVAHELLLRIRGGPLRELVIEGVDADAEPMSDATATRARAGRNAGLPIPLSVDAEGGHLALKVEYKKGLRGGTYLFRVRYRTHLANANRIEARGGRALVSWEGPSFDDGIDSARVALRLPRGETPPSLPESESDDDTIDVVEEHHGVFLSTLRRSDDADELDIVRPHVAKGERVVWRASVDPSAFDLDLAAPTRAAPPAPTAAPIIPKDPERDWRVWMLIAIAALGYASLVTLKTRAVALAATARRATARPLVRFHWLLRALLSAALFGSAVCVGVTTEHPTLGAALLIGAMALGVHLSPLVKPPLKGPGDWKVVADESVLDPPPDRPKLAGRFLDAGSPAGFLVFAGLLCVFVVSAAMVFPLSPYHGVMVALGSASLFPVFCTGRAAELPADPVDAPRRHLAWLRAKLSKRPRIVVELVARFPRAGSMPDDLRLRVTPARTRPGFVAIEMGVDYHQGTAGFIAVPFVIVRVIEGSESYDALPTGLYWSRGRTADERVSVMRPRLPTRNAWLALSKEIVDAVSAAVRARRAGRRKRQPAIKAAISLGKGSSTEKPSTASSPAHAT